jgi:excinuclease UvrABC nuclease subunit
MRKFRLTSVYSAPGKTNIREFVGRPGVYLIYKDGELRYIGHSQTDVYKTLIRHFQAWNDKTQKRVTYPQRPEYKTRIILTTEGQAPRLESYLIKQLRPPDNPDKQEALRFTPDIKKAGQIYKNTYVEDIPF